MITINLNSSHLDEIEFMLRIPIIMLSKFSALIILNLEMQSLCNIDAPLNVVFYVSGFVFIDLLKIDCQSDKLPFSW